MASGGLRMANTRIVLLMIFFFVAIQRNKCRVNSSVTSSITSGNASQSTASTTHPSLSNTMTSRTKNTSSTTINPTSASLPLFSSNAASSNASNSSAGIPVVPSTALQTSIIFTKDSPSSDSRPTMTSPSTVLITSSIASPGTSGDSDEDSEPKVNLYVWQIVAIACGAFVLILFIIIGLLCYQNKRLKRSLKNSRSYKLSVKENGDWIDNQDIPLWQKRASAFVKENPTDVAGDVAPTLTT